MNHISHIYKRTAWRAVEQGHSEECYELAHLELEDVLKKSCHSFQVAEEDFFITDKDQEHRAPRERYQSFG